MSRDWRSSAIARLTAASLAALLAVLLLVGASLPRPTGLVVDEAGILSVAEKQEIEATAQRLKDTTGAELAVVAVESTDGRGSKAYAVELFEAWGIGEKGKDTGVLLLLVTGDERRVEIEVGYGLEGVLTDGAAGRILDNHVVPHLRDGRPGAALTAGADAIAAHVQAGLGAENSDGTGGAIPARSSGSFWPLLLIFTGAFALWALIAHLFRPRCPRCRSRIISHRKVLQHPTYAVAGLAVLHHFCRKCGWSEEGRTIPLPAFSRGAGGFGHRPGGMGGGRGGFGGFGGGRSGGGGAGRGW